MASADVIPEYDIPRISSFLSVPQESVDALAAIAEDYVTQILISITRKAREFDELKADKMRSEVELEQTVRSAENKVKVMKSQIDAILKENVALRTKLRDEENARTQLEDDLSNTRSVRSNVDDETRALRARVQSLESDKRETLEALERKNTDYDRLQDEYQTVQSRVIETRTELGRLESELQQSQSSQTSAKFREQNLQQEIELLRKNNEWLESELKTKTAEFQKFRKEKAAQMSTLQRELEDALSSCDMAKRNSATMKTRYEEVCKQAEDALQKIKTLEEKFVTQEEAFRAEMSSRERLSGLWEQATNEARKRAAELDQLLEEERAKESIEIGQAHAEAETERAEKEAAEQKIAELEVQVERLEADLDAYRNGAILPPGTPQRPTNGASTPQRPGSSAGLGIFSPAAARLQKSGISMTQLYSDYTSVKAELDSERRRNEKLQSHFDELMHDLELKAPLFEEQRAEHERMQGEIVEMSLMMEEVGKERDRAKKMVQKMEVRISSFERESGALKQQLRDLSLQVQLLLSEVEHISSGNEQFSTAERIRFQQYVNGELPHDPSMDETPIDKIITERLLRFKNIHELQSQNENLLKVTRELAAKLEDDERKAEKDLAGRQAQEVEDLKKNLDRYRDELKAMNTKSQSYVRERDMFRRMLQNRGEVPKGGAGEEENRQQSPGSEAGSVQAQSVQNYINALKELQLQFDQYKHEASTDHNTLKAQNQKLAQEKSELQLQVAKVGSKLELDKQRFEMLKGNFDMLQNENQELQKRVTTLHEIQAKQDVYSQQISEELNDARSLLESMRSDNANLKAEKDLRKKIETRLSEDNEALTLERARLNGHISSLQALQAERERSDEESRRRLQSRVEKLEQELQTTKRKLSEEIDEAKRVLVKKDYNIQELQKRVDELTQALGKAREEFVEARTQRDSLQSRVNELVVELKAAEEKLTVFQPKTTSADTDDTNMADRAENDNDEDEEEEALSKEQELQAQVADLTRDLDHAKQELASAKEQIEQYKNIAQSAEEELENMNSIHDQYKESMEAQAQDHEAHIKDIEQRVEDLSTELSDTNEELSQLRQSEADKQRRFDDEKSLLELEIQRLKDDAEKNISAAAFYQDDLRAQARIAQEAQQNYERELVKHAEAAQALQKVRVEFSELKTEVHGLRGQAEAAEERLVSSAESWSVQKENYEKELGEISSRCEDLKKQNKSLLEQLDNVGVQISDLQKSRSAAEDTMETQDDTNMSDDPLEKLRRTFTWLRREKEIVDVQYELNLQETKRLKQQLDYSQNALDEARLLLAQERERQTSRLQGEEHHKNLMEKINELNLLRESNTALRGDGERKGKRVQELQTRVEELTAKIQPLEEKVRQLEAEREVKDAQIRMIQEDNDRWKSRTQQILQKYDRVDPEALEAMKSEVKTLQEQIATVTAERDQAISESQERQTLHAKELENVASSWKAKLDRLVQDTKERLKNLRAQLNEKNAEVESAKQQLEMQRQELERAIAERDTARQQAHSQEIHSNSNTAAVIQQNAEERRRLEEEKQALVAERNGLADRLQKVEQDLTNTRRTAQEYFRELGLHKRKAEENEARIQQLQANPPQAPAQITNSDQQQATVEGQQPSASQSADLEAIVAERLNQERERLNHERQELERRVAAEKEKYEALITKKERDHEAAINKLLEEQAGKIEEAKAALRQDYDSRIAELEQKIRDLEEKLEQARTASPTPGAAPGAPNAAQQQLPPNEELKKIVKRNVEHRLAKEREKWEKESEMSREELVQARLAEEIEKTLKAREEEWVSKEKEWTTKEEEWVAKEAEMVAKNTKALESAKESAKQEAMMRSKVQVSMLEKKNKALEEKMKALESGGASNAAASPGNPPAPAVRHSLPTPVQQQQIPPPLQLHQQLPAQPQQQGQSPTPAQQAQPPTPTQQQRPPTPNQQPQQLQRSNSQQSTGDAAPQQGGIPRIPQPVGHPAIRSLRGALSSNIPRGGAGGAGRGLPQPGQPPQQQQQQQQQQGQPRMLQQPGHQMGGQPSHLAHHSMIQQQLQQAQAHQQQQLQHQHQLPGGGRGGSQLPTSRGGPTGIGGGQSIRGGFGRGGMRGGGQQQQGLPSPQHQLPQLQIAMGGGQQPQQQQQGGGSPGGGPKLNVNAKQFMPGKRPREDGEIDDGDVQNFGAGGGGGGGHPHQGGKRIRGGGGQGPAQ